MVIQRHLKRGAVILDRLSHNPELILKKNTLFDFIPMYPGHSIGVSSVLSPEEAELPVLKTWYEHFSGQNIPCITVYKYYPKKARYHYAMFKERRVADHV